MTSIMTNGAPHLSRRCIDVLLDGSHAEIGGRTRRLRGKKLPLIAASYSYAELLDEKGVGEVTALEIGDWLHRQGLSLKADAEGMISREIG